MAEILAGDNQKSLNLVVVSDVHLHYWKAFSEGHGAQGSRFLRTLQVLRDSLEAACEMKCPWVCAGDWVHTIGWAHNGVLTYLIQLLKQFEDVEKITVWGNHDSRSHGGEISIEESVVGVLGRSVANLVVLDRSLHVTSTGLRIYGEGYQPKREFLSILKKDDLIEALEFDVGVFHQTVSGSRLASGLEVKNAVSGLFKDELWKRFRLSIVGDIHHPQAFIEGNRVILVPGSPEHHNFGDLDEHGWWRCFLVENGDVQCLFQTSNSPKFLTVVNASDVQEDQNYYRVLTPCEVEDLPAKAVSVSSRPTSITQRNLFQEGSSAREVLQAWLQIEPPPEGDADTFLATGISLLSAEGLNRLRPIKVQEVKLYNFMCFAEEDFNVTDGVTLIMGEARDYESNGAGKTTLFEAIFWGLFGRTTKGVSADDVIKWGETKTQVQIVLEDENGVPLRIIRTRVRGVGGGLEIFGSEGIWGGSPAELTKLLQQYLGVTPELFQALAYFSQSKLVLFSQASDSERKAMLTDLCGLDVYQNASSEARSQEQECQRKMVLCDQAIRRDAEELKLTYSLMEDAIIRQGAWRNALDVQAETLKAELGRLEKHYAEFDSQSEIELTQIDLDFKTKFQAIDNVRVQRKEALESEIKTNMEGARDRYTEVLKALPEECRSGSVAWQAELDQSDAAKNEVQIKATTLRTQLAAARVALDKIMVLKDQCPECGQSISAEFHKEHQAKLASVVDLLEDELSVVEEEYGQRVQWVNTANQMRKHALTLENETRDRDRRLDSLTRDLEAIDQKVLSEINDAMAELHQTKALKEQAVRSKISGLKDRSQTRQAEITARLLEIAAEKDPLVDLLEKAHERCTFLEQQAKQTASEMAISRWQSVALAYWAKGFSRAGIQSVLLEGIAAEFNQIRSVIFPLLTRGIYDVQFSTTSQTAEGEAREKSAFVIRDRDALVGYESLSGGQRRRVDLGVMLTLALAVAKTRQVPGVLGMLILDEVFGFLDSDGVEALYETLDQVQMVIPCIYAVTHDPDLQSLFRNVILVRQDQQGVSRLVIQPPTGE